ASRAGDRIIEHSITYALIEIGDLRGTAAGLRIKDSRVRRSALVALDQMDGGGLDPQLVAGLLSAPEDSLKTTASWIVGRHREWAGTLAGVLGQQLVRTDLTAAERTELERQLGHFAESGPIQELLAARLRDASGLAAARESSLRAMAQAGLKEKHVPLSWVAALAGLLDGDRSKADLTELAVATVRALPVKRATAGELPARLLRIAGDEANPAELRLNALAAMPEGLAAVDD